MGLRARSRSARWARCHACYRRSRSTSSSTTPYALALRLTRTHHEPSSLPLSPLSRAAAHSRCRLVLPTSRRPRSISSPSQRARERCCSSVNGGEHTLTPCSMHTLLILPEPRSRVRNVRCTVCMYILLWCLVSCVSVECSEVCLCVSYGEIRIMYTSHTTRTIARSPLPRNAQHSPQTQTRCAHATHRDCREHGCQ